MKLEPRKIFDNNLSLAFVYIRLKGIPHFDVIKGTPIKTAISEFIMSPGIKQFYQEVMWWFLKAATLAGNMVNKVTITMPQTSHKYGPMKGF